MYVCTNNILYCGIPVCVHLCKAMLTSLFFMCDNTYQPFTLYRKGDITYTHKNVFR